MHFVTMTAIGALLLFQPPAKAAPQGGNVVAGSATIGTAGTTTNVNQSTSKAIINWQAFSVGRQETVNFNQPSATSVTLNRVVGNESSIIAGAINANGQVFLVNTNGILFTGTSRVNVGGLVASTLDIADQDFLSGKYTFSGASTQSVVNQGTITAASGGYVSLLGKTVSNEGTISAQLGTVSLNAGSKITLNFEGNSLFDVTLDQGVVDALVENKGLIKADGGKVIMTAKAADAVLSAQVNNSGIVQARTMASLTGGTTTYKKGSITLKATGGTANVSGTLDASAPNGGDGGFIETSGDKVKFGDVVTITTAASYGLTGTWLIDPDGFTIAASGGDITGEALGSLLESNNVVIESTQGSGTDGDVTVNDTVSWLAGTILTLNATNDININAPIYAGGAGAGVVLNYGGYAATGGTASGSDYYMGYNGSISLPGAGASLTINGQSYTLIHSMAELAAINGSNGYYAFAQNIDASGIIYTASVVDSFTGTLAGLGHVISGLTINATIDGRVALVGALGSETDSDAVLRDLGLLDPTVTASGSTYAATLVGGNYGLINNSYAIDVFVVSDYAAGLVQTNFSTGIIRNSFVGRSDTGSSTVNSLATQSNMVSGFVSLNYGLIEGSYSQASVTSYGIGAGFVGTNYAGGTIRNSYATGDVTTYGGTAGGFGSDNRGTISGSYSTGAVTSNFWNLNTGPGDASAGGFLYSNSGTVTDSWSSSNVTVDNTGSGTLATTFTIVAGGFIGYNEGGTLDGVSAYGNVSNATGSAGGLVGRTNGISTIRNALATGNVQGYRYVAGLIGFTAGTTTVSAANAFGNTYASYSRAYSGGMVGYNNGTLNITDSYSHGTQSGSGTLSNYIGFRGKGSNVDSGYRDDPDGTDKAAAYARRDADLARASSDAANAAARNAAKIRAPTFQAAAAQVATDRALKREADRLEEERRKQQEQADKEQADKDKAAQDKADQDKADQDRADKAKRDRDAAQLAAQKARRDAAAKAATVTATTGTQQAADTPPAPAQSQAGSQATMALAGPALLNQIDTSAAPPAATAVPEDDERERRRSQQTRQPAGPQPGYGATIRSIEINGKQFDLEKEDATPGAAPGAAPAEGAPAPAAGAPAPAAGAPAPAGATPAPATGQ